MGSLRLGAVILPLALLAPAAQPGGLRPVPTVEHELLVGSGQGVEGQDGGKAVGKEGSTAHGQGSPGSSPR